ncbi:MAG: hypothetical protein H6Q70_508 [Firmicutes bacterium]|nr:hypothetical protein [Bacillota bacterium]
MSKILNFPNNSQEIADMVNQKISKGTIEGLAVVIKNKDGTFEIRWDKKLNYLDLIGMLETAKQDIYMRANDII